MSYVSKNYDNNPNAPMGSWVGLAHGVAYSGTTPTDPKADEAKEENAKLLEIATKAHKHFYPVNYEYGQCVSYVKAVTPGLPQTSKWVKGIQVSGGYHQKPKSVHPVVAQHSQSERAAAVHHGAAHHKAALHGTVIHAAPPAQLPVPEPSMFQKIENALDFHLNFQHYEDETRSEYEHLLHSAPDQFHAPSGHAPSVGHTPVAGSSTFSAPKIPVGTVIATFTKDGKYQGHAAIYEKQDDSGIYVVNQWISGKKPMPVSRYKFTFKFGMGSNPTNVNDGDNYYVVE